MEKTLFDRLQEYQDQEVYPFHMPGHKRRLSSPGNLYELDITEIDGFDSLHHAEGILKDVSRRAAHLYQAEESFLLVNGSTAGLLCAVSACTDFDGYILIARNCHRAVYHAVYLRHLHVDYLYPERVQGWGIYGGISVREVEKAFVRAESRRQKIQAVVVTSPTYEGVVSDIAAIAECCHRHGAVLVVDEAHGAHFGFHPQLPVSAVNLGADMVVQSLHKTMPAVTQTALLHVSGENVDREKIRRFSSVYQSSSPSYLLMGSIDKCLSMIEEDGVTLFEEYMRRLKVCRERLSECHNIRLFSLDKQEKAEAAVYDMDVGRLVFSTKGIRGKLNSTSRSQGCVISGNMLMERLRNDFQLEMEMAGPDYVVAITSVMDSEDGYARLCEAIETIDCEVGEGIYSEDGADEEKTRGGLNRSGAAAGDEQSGECQSAAGDKETSAGQDHVLSVMPIYEAWDSRWEACPYEKAVGRIAAEFILIYPPGIPVIAPGERIDKVQLEHISKAKEQGLSVEGISDWTMKTLRVVI